MQQIDTNFPWSVLLSTIEMISTCSIKWKTAGDWFHCKINLDLSSRDFTGSFRSRGGKLEERFQAIHPSRFDICPSRFWL